jgi:lipid-binding SYLF domain-containing protein
MQWRLVPIAFHHVRLCQVMSGQVMPYCIVSYFHDSLAQHQLLLSRMHTIISKTKFKQYRWSLLPYGRFQLAREPLRVCVGCHQQLHHLQEELRNTNSNAMRFNHIDPTDPKRFLNSPLAFTLGHEVRKAAYALNNMLPLPKRMGTSHFTDNPDSFLSGDDLDIQQCKDECASITPNFSNLDGVKIPARLLEEAKGVAVLTVAKGGFGVAGIEFGTGLVVARLGENQQWSAPCAIGTAGMSWGALIGAQVSDHVFLLMTDAAVELMFNNNGNLQLGADIGVAVGPMGRAIEADFAASRGAFAPIYTYSLSKGMYAGISLDGKVIVTRNRVNEKFYGREVTGQQILDGEIPSPPAARPLYDALQRCHVYARNDAGGNSSSNVLHRQRPQTRVMNGYPEMPPTTDLDPYSLSDHFINDNSTIAGNGQHYRQEQQSPHHNPYSPRTTRFGYAGDPLMPPAPNDQHSYTGQSCATGLSDITSDPGY